MHAAHATDQAQTGLRPANGEPGRLQPGQAVLRGEGAAQNSLLPAARVAQVVQDLLQVLVVEVRLQGVLLHQRAEQAMEMLQRTDHLSNRVDERIASSRR